MTRAVRVFLCAVLLLMFLCPTAHSLNCGYRIIVEHEGVEYDLGIGYPSYYGTNCVWSDYFPTTGGYNRNYSVGINDGGLGMDLDSWFALVQDYAWLDSPCNRNYDYFQGPAASDVTDPTGSYSVRHFYEGSVSCGGTMINVRRVPLDVNVEVEPEGAGTVVVNPSKEGYSIEDVVEVTARPGPDWVFDKWTSPSTSYSNPLSYTLYGYGTTFHAVFKDSQLRVEEGEYNPNVGYFNPYGGVYRVLANHFTLTNKVEQDATVSELSFTIVGDLSLVSGAALIRDYGCIGAGTEIATTADVSGGTVTFSGLSETVSGGSERCYGLILSFNEGVTIPFREEYTVSISRGQVKAQVSWNSADVSGDTVTGTVCSAGPKITLAAAYDGSGGADTRVGTFLGGIEVNNMLTARIDMEPEDFATVNRVVFDINGTAKEGSVVEAGSRYEATYNMGDFQQTVPLTVTAHMNMNGTSIEAREDFSLKALAMPGWLDVVTEISESLTKEFNPEEKAYKVGFSYPVDFVWKDTIPSSVGLLGGLGNDLGVEFSAAANYGIDETGSFSADVTGTPKILGKELELQGGLSGDFDSDFAFTGGKGTVKAKLDFDLPEKGYAKTFLVYGVPVTAAVDLGGNISLFVSGTAVLNRSLEFEKASVSPGVTVTGSVTVSLSAVFGLAKVAARGEPYVTLEIQMVYTTAEGTKTTWTGEVAVPITVVGSVFWGAAKAKLCSTQLGPWTFGSGRTAMGIRPLDLEEPEAPRLFSTYGIAADGTGRRMVVWIGDAEPGGAYPNPDVFYRFTDGSGWSDAAALIGSASPNEEWEMDPAVVFMAGGMALAAWTANDGSKSLDNLNDIFAAQDIAYAVWDGSGWSAPGRIIDDGEADGTAALGYDGDSGQVVCVWVHDANSDRDVGTRGEWTIMSSVFSPVTGQWTAPLAVGGTGESGADFMPGVAFDGSGSGLVVWARDADGVFMEVLDEVADGTNVSYGNGDSEIMCSWWDGSGWGEARAVTAADGWMDLSPSVACGPGGSFVVVWVKKEGTLERLFCRVFSDGAWSDPVAVHEGGAVEDPRVVVNSENVATVVWKGGNDLWSATANLEGDGAAVWSEAARLTSDHEIDWSPAVAVSETGAVSLAWGKFDPVSNGAAGGSGMSDGVYMGTADSDAAAFTGVYGDEAVDDDDDGLVDSVRVSVPVQVHEAGDYEVRADLYSGQTRIVAAGSVFTGLEAGTHTLVLEFSGSVIRDMGIDGPYEVRNLVLIRVGEGDLVVASDSGPYTTSAYDADGFEAPALGLDKEEYLGTDAEAVVAFVSSTAHGDPGTVETVTVQVTSSADTEGIDLVLTETGVDTGIFVGGLGFDAGASSEAEAEILVSGTSLVQVEYRDVDSDHVWTASCAWLPRALGDVNLDRAVDVTDAVLILKVLAGFDAGETVGCYVEQGMILGGGSGLGLADALYILQTAASVR